MEKKIIKSFTIIVILVSLLIVNIQGFAYALRTIRVSGAWALYPMMVVWADEYQKINDLKIEVSGGGAGKGVSDVLNGQVDIGMVSRPIRNEEIEQGVFYTAVVKDSVVAVINDKNPIIDEIYKRGLSREDLRKIFTQEITNWGNIVDENIENDQIIVYGRSDASGAAKVWASFLGDYTQADIQKTADANFSGDQQLAAAVQSDKNAVGFSNLNYAYDIVTGGFVENLCPVPLDLNDNGLLDPEEKFYEDRETFIKGVSTGLYPSPPARRDYLVGNGPFTDDIEDFVFWILTEGQQYVVDNAYVCLSEEELAEELFLLQKGKRD